MSKAHSGRILAVVVRSGRLGYAALENPRRLLDFGVSKFESAAVARERTTGFLKVFRPSALILRKLPLRPKRNARTRKPVQRTLTATARHLSITAIYVPDRAMKEFWKHHGCKNKYQIAALMTTWFPQLASRLPHKKKFYDPEPWTMTAFDAIALGAAYLDSEP